MKRPERSGKSRMVPPAFRPGPLPAAGVRRKLGFAQALREPEPSYEADALNDILNELRLCNDDGSIWLGERRMLLLHANVIGTMRKELIAALGLEAARELITRMGYDAGFQDAELVRRLRPDTDARNAFMAGPQAFAIEGFGPIEMIRFEMDRLTGHHLSEFIWLNSPGAQLQIEADDASAVPACWLEVGYASGYASSFLGRRILVREVECRAMGHTHCRSIAKPAEDWDDGEDYPRHSAKAADLAPADHGPATGHSGPVDRVGGDDPLLGAAPAFLAAMDKVRRVAPTNATVLLLGESGVGKTVLAREVHRLSNRAAQPFVEVNCAAIPEQLLEAELFGVEPGAFTGAKKARPGRFQVAERGTMFLDEIGLLPLSAQGKLLRVLQSGELEALGSSRTRKVDVRIVAASNDNLRQAVADGRFREDLFYRINVFPIVVPPLRERREDIPALLGRCLERFGRRHGRRLGGVTARAMQALLVHDWPGNIREFENAIERAVILSEEGEAIDTPGLMPRPGGEWLTEVPPACLYGAMAHGSPAERGEGNSSIAQWLDRGMRLDDLEGAMISEALRRCAGNVSRAAGLLGLSRAQLDYRLRKRREAGSSFGE